jgi:hypothetical protein
MASSRSPHLDRFFLDPRILPEIMRETSKRSSLEVLFGSIVCASMTRWSRVLFFLIQTPARSIRRPAEHGMSASAVVVRQHGQKIRPLARWRLRLSRAAASHAKAHFVRSSATARGLSTIASRDDVLVRKRLAL